MLRRITSLFESDQRLRGTGVVTLIISDYLAHYRRRTESPRRLAVLFIPRMLTNSELHATALMRIALGGPRLCFWFWRMVLLAKHSIDILPEMTIGPGLRLPHPHGMTLGWALTIGSDVTIYQNVNIGALANPREERREEVLPHVPASVWSPCPRIGDGAIIYANSFVLGPITVGRNAVVGANSWLTHDLEPESTHRGMTQ